MSAVQVTVMRVINPAARPATAGEMFVRFSLARISGSIENGFRLGTRRVVLELVLCASGGVNGFLVFEVDMMPVIRLSFVPWDGATTP
jgi:hypothetical protein